MSMDLEVKDRAGLLRYDPKAGDEEQERYFFADWRENGNFNCHNGHRAQLVQAMREAHIPTDRHFDGDVHWIGPLCCRIIAGRLAEHPDAYVRDFAAYMNFASQRGGCTVS